MRKTCSWAPFSWTSRARPGRLAEKVSQSIPAWRERRKPTGRRAVRRRKAAFGNLPRPDHAAGNSSGRRASIGPGTPLIEMVFEISQGVCSTDEGKTIIMVEQNAKRAWSSPTSAMSWSPGSWPWPTAATGF